MKLTKLFMRLIPVAVLLASSGAFAIKVTTGTPDFELNINLLIQARAVGSWNGDAPAATNSAAPNGAFDTDFYIRRARLIASGTAFKHVIFYLMLDEPNFGIRGNYNIAANPAFVQDVHIGYEFVKDIVVEAGFVYMPLSHLAVNSSSSTSSIEKNTAIIFYNNARGLRETGVQFRGLFLDQKIFFRGGLFDGLRGLQGSDPPPPATNPLSQGGVVNPHGVPLFAGMVRYNLIGSESGYSFPSVYLDGKTRVSVGVGGQYQTKGSNTPITIINAAGNRATTNTAVNNYGAISADVFADVALPGDQEAHIQTDFYRFDWGSGSDKTGYGATVELGYRFGQIEPEVNGFWFNSESKQGNYAKIAAGLNYFLKGHQWKFSGEYWNIKQNVNWDTSNYLSQIVLQLQASL
jgi:hypothetical protein